MVDLLDAFDDAMRTLILEHAHEVDAHAEAVLRMLELPSLRHARAVESRLKLYRACSPAVVESLIEMATAKKIWMDRPFVGKAALSPLLAEWVFSARTAAVKPAFLEFYRSFVALVQTAANEAGQSEEKAEGNACLAMRNSNKMLHRLERLQNRLHRDLRKWTDESPTVSKKLSEIEPKERLALVEEVSEMIQDATPFMPELLVVFFDLLCAASQRAKEHGKHHEDDVRWLESLWKRWAALATKPSVISVTVPCAALAFFSFFKFSSKSELWTPQAFQFVFDSLWNSTTGALSAMHASATHLVLHDLLDVDIRHTAALSRQPRESNEHACPSIQLFFDLIESEQ